MLKLVPFNQAWITHDKIDVHAIYRRPRYTKDDYGEDQREVHAETGEPTWDITSPLPVKQHSKWLAKGFEYVTVADRDSLRRAALHRTVLDEHGEACDWRVYDQHQTGGPWNLRRYMEGLSSTTTLANDQLRADVEKYGPETVENIRRRYEPGFRVPDHLRHLGPKDTPLDALPDPPIEATVALPPVEKPKPKAAAKPAPKAKEPKPAEATA